MILIVIMGNVAWWLTADEMFLHHHYSSMGLRSQCAKINIFLSFLSSLISERRQFEAVTFGWSSMRG